MLNEDIETDIDQTLLKKLFKTAPIWDFLREFHCTQFEGIKELFAMIGDGNNNWDSGLHRDKITKLLSECERIGHHISQGLVKESSNLIERVCIQYQPTLCILTLNTYLSGKKVHETR